MTTTFALGRQHAVRFCAWLAVCAAAASAAVAQTPSPRITQAVNDASRVTLRNSISPVLRAAVDRGAVSDTTPIESMRILLSRTPEQEEALGLYLAELQQKSSPNYHKWLTPDQFGARYGAAESDIATVTAWLESQGFTGVSANRARTAIAFSGTAATVQQAFHTSIHSFSLNGRQFNSNTASPTIPAALAPVVAGIAHLDTIGPRPMSHAGLPGQINPQTKRLEPIAGSSSSLHSDITLSDGTNNYLYLTPGDAATIYNTPTTLNANLSSTAYTGSGVTIGIIGTAAISTTPLANYRTQFLGETTASLPAITNFPQTSSTSAAGEAYLDIEVSGGLAPGAAQRFYTGSDGSLLTQIDGAIGENAIDILSVSFGLCEQDMTSTQNAEYASYWQQAAAQGIAVAVSTGDSGSAGCDSTTDNSGNNITTATGGLAVSGLASTPYNIAVGGTDFQLTQGNYSTYASTSNTGAYLYRTAKSYIPELVWNDSTQVRTTLSANVPWSTASSKNIVAASGGYSSCSTNNTSSTLGSCTGHYSKPTWQRGTGVPSDGARDLPDISLMSGVDYYSAWLVCTNSTYTSGNTTYTLDCGSNTGGSYTGYGGTSAATPAFAGILALVQQSQGGGRLGQAAANLYNIYNNSASASSIFHDITVGNNSVPCSSGSTNCALNTAGSYFETGYNSSIGYDLASGLGSVDATQLVTHWSDGMGTATATLGVTPSATAITTANTLTLTVTVSGSSNTPSGSVTASGGGYTSSAVNLDGGTATILIPAGALAAGADTLTVSYSGDGIYSAATNNSVVVTVTAGSLTATTTTVASSSTTPTYGASVTFTATVAPTAATGTVYFYDGSTLLGSNTLTSGTTTYSTAYLTLGAHSITAQYLGNGTYAPSTSSSTTVTVSSGSSGGSGSFSLSATNVSVSQGSSGNSTVTVTPSGGYTGTVGFTMSTSSTSLQNYGCYAINSATVSGTTAVTTTLTFYTKESDCSNTSAVKKNGVQRFSGAMKQVAANQPTSPLGGKTLPAGMAALAGVVLFGLRKRARWMGMLGCVMLLCGLGLAVGCGGSSSSSSSNEVAKGTYSVTLTGADTTTSSITASTTLTLTVK